METQIQQFDTDPLSAATGVPIGAPATPESSTSTPTILSTFEDEATIKDQLRACWQRGDEWRLEFGRLLVKLRVVTPHGEWIKFVESEFHLQRQTAHNWMNLAKAADGVQLDEPDTDTDSDEPDNYETDLTGAIESEQDKVNKAKQEIKLNAARARKLTLDDVTEDEYELFKEQIKTDRVWAQSVLRAAFDQIIAGKPPVETDGQRKTLNLLAEDAEDSGPYNLVEVTEENVTTFCGPFTEAYGA